MSTMKYSRTVFYGPSTTGITYPSVGSVSAGESIDILWQTTSGLTANYIEYGHISSCPYSCPTIAYSKTESGIDYPYKLWEGVYPCSWDAFSTRGNITLGSVQITAGQYLGLSGSTGNSTGPHLHIELK